MRLARFGKFKFFLMQQALRSPLARQIDFGGRRSGSLARDPRTSGEFGVPRSPSPSLSTMRLRPQRAPTSRRVSLRYLSRMAVKPISPTSLSKPRNNQSSEGTPLNSRSRTRDAQEMPLLATKTFKGAAQLIAMGFSMPKTMSGNFPSMAQVQC